MSERHEIVGAIMRLTQSAATRKRRGSRCATHDHLWPCPFRILTKEVDRIVERYRTRALPHRTPTDYPERSPARANCTVQPGMLVQRLEFRDDVTVKSPVYRVVEVVDDCFCPPYLYELDCPLVYAGSGCPGAGDGCADCPKVLEPHIHLTLCPPEVERPRDNQLFIFGRLVQVDEKTLWELDNEHPTRIASGVRIAVLGWAPNYQRSLFAAESQTETETGLQ